MNASRVLLLVAVFSSVACGGKILGETAPPDTDDDSVAPTPAPSESQPDAGEAQHRAGEKSRMAPVADPFAPGQHWLGTYTCAQGLTDLDLEIVSMKGDIIDDAVFDFDWVSGGVSGSYHLSGSFDASTGAADFATVSWIDQPEGWMMVGMHGAATPTTFAGDITNGSCTTFSLTKS